MLCKTYIIKRKNMTKTRYLMFFFCFCKYALILNSMAATTFQMSAQEHVYHHLLFSTALGNHLGRFKGEITLSGSCLICHTFSMGGQSNTCSLLPKKCCCNTCRVWLITVLLELAGTSLKKTPPGRQRMLFQILCVLF